MTALKSCPHCNEPVIAKQGYGDITYFICGYKRGCGMVTSFAPRKKGSAAFAAFNRRANAGDQRDREEER